MSESKLIKGSDLIAPKFLKDSIEQATVFLKILSETKKVIVDTNKATSQKLKSSTGSASKDLKEQNDLIKESNRQRKLAAEVDIVNIRATLDLAKAKKALADFEKKKLADDQKAIKAAEAQNSAYAKASARLNQLRKDYKDLALSGKSADKATQDLLKTIQQLDKDLKKVDADVGQFNRSVGDYKNQMKEAINETGLFTEGLNKLGSQQNEIIAGFGAIVGQLKSLKKAEGEAEVASGKLNKSLKASVIIAVVAALASLLSFFTSSREGALEFDLILAKLKGTLDVLLGSIIKIGKGLVGLGTALKLAFQGDFAGASEAASKAIDDLSTSFDNNVSKISNQIKGYEDLARSIFELEDQLMKLNIALEQAKMDEEDFNEIAADSTISLNKQKAALEGAIQQRLIQAKIGKQIADSEYEISVKKLKQDLRIKDVSEENIALIDKQGYKAFLNSKLTIKASDDTLKALQESYLKQLAADDRLDDLDRQEAERRRQRIQTDTLNEIELIRSKKLGADEQVKILTKQVSDEKNQLQDRQNFEDQLKQKQDEALKEEIKLFEKFGLSQAEVLDLINEKDAVRLANRITQLNKDIISTEVATELAKVVLEAQTNELAYQDQLAKFEDERIKREQKILQLNREINIINENSLLNEVENIEKNRQDILNKSNEKILQGNNVFNQKLLKQRKEASDQEAVIVDTEFKLKKDIIDEQYKLDQDNINNSVNDEQIKNKELEKLEASYNSNVEKLNIDQETKNKELKATELATQKNIELRKIEIVTDSLTKATQALSTELDKRNAIQDNNAQNQISQTESLIDKQRDLAARGLANTLAYQESQLAKEQLRQQDLAKKQAKQKEDIALAEALLNAYNSELKQSNANPNTAAAKALADVLLFKGLAAGLVQFAAEGEDRVKGPGTRTSDSVPFMLSVDEGVVKAKANMENPGVVSALNSDMFDKLYMPRYDLSNDTPSTSNNISNSLLLQNNKEIINLLKEINNKPIQQVDVDGLGNLIELTYEKGIKKITKYKNRRSIG